jgi:hypothetical protein
MFGKFIKIPVLYIIFLLLVIFPSVGCQPKTVTRGRKFHQCKDYELDVPIESADVETNGKKSGDTHFPSFSTGSEVGYSYHRFEAAEAAIEALKGNEERAWRILRKGELKDNNGTKIGEKLFITTSAAYELIWTKGMKINNLSSESFEAVEEIEKDCNL